MVISPSDGYFSVRYGPTKIEYRRMMNAIGITLLITDRGSEGQGHARRAMMQFLEQCDLECCDVFLTPVATERHVSKSRLRAFYTEMGFKRNLERQKDYWSAETVEAHYAMKRLHEPEVIPTVSKRKKCTI